VVEHEGDERHEQEGKIHQGKLVEQHRPSHGRSARPGSASGVKGSMWGGCDGWPKISR
jgi:hypothetical protein